MKPINRHYEVYERCVNEAITYLNQAIYYIKEMTEEEGQYPDTMYSLYKMKYYLINERLTK